MEEILMQLDKNPVEIRGVGGGYGQLWTNK